MSLSLQESDTLKAVAAQAAVDALAKREAAGRLDIVRQALRDARRKLGLEMGWGGEREQQAIRNLKQAEKQEQQAELDYQQISSQAKESLQLLYEDSAFEPLRQRVIQDNAFAEDWNQVWLNFSTRLAAYANKTDQEFIPYFLAALRNARLDNYRRSGKATRALTENSQPAEGPPLDMARLAELREEFCPEPISRGELDEAGFSTDKSVRQVMPLFIIYRLYPKCSQTREIWKQAGMPDRVDWLMSQPVDYRKHESFTLMAEQRIKDTKQGIMAEKSSGASISASEDECSPEQQFERIRNQTQNKKWQNLAREKLWRILLTPSGWSAIRGSFDWNSIGRRSEFSEIRYWIDRAEDDPQAAVFLLVNRLWLFMKTPQQLNRVFQNHGICNNVSFNFVRIALKEDPAEQLRVLRFSDQQKDLRWCRNALQHCQRTCESKELLAHFNAGFFEQLFLFEASSNRNLKLRLLRERSAAEDEVSS